MKQQTFGTTVAALRKARGMTQLDLADRMGVTDKAVSKWERDLSFPDTASLPKLAETLGVTVDELMLGRQAETALAPTKAAQLIALILQGVALAMGIAVTVLAALHQLEADDALPMLGLGLACLAAAQLAGRET